MLVSLECMYCGHKWKMNAYDKASIERQDCTRCGDTTLTVRNAEEASVDAYKGCPPFPEPTPDAIDEWLKTNKDLMDDLEEMEKREKAHHDDRDDDYSGFDDFHD